jgi:basic amino acid/polyamine antiporter, APA family
MQNIFRKKSIEMILRHADESNPDLMKRRLGVRDLTAMGIAAIIGAGIFSTIGNAAASGGPAVSLLFVFTAIACGLSAMCYAEFASAIPISGSAYTYAYASFGELIAWIIGWDLIMEYAIGNIAVAISWSGYFTGLLSGLHINIPEYLAIDYLSASKGFKLATEQLQSGITIAGLDVNLREAYQAWLTAPHIGSIRFIADIPALGIVVFITWLVYKGIYETKMAGNIMVLIKIGILMLVIAVGSFYIDPKNWSPFAPNGIGGVLKGISGVFFAYIGFDAISTTAEECKNPRRDLPRSMIYSLAITTVLYVIISLVLTGMVPFSQLGVSDPLAFAFEKLHLTKLSGVIALGAVIAMAGVLLVFQVGQPRIWMSMSRDGLLPPRFSKLHKKYRTPAFATIVTGFMVAIPALFLNLTEVTDLTSIGTLFAFILVSGGVLILHPRGNNDLNKRGFNVPYANSRLYLLPIWAVILFIIWLSNPGFFAGIFNGSNHVSKGFHNQLPMFVFIIGAILTTVYAVIRQWSLIPVLGLLTNLYLMSELGITNWMRFLIWLVIGLVLYFAYGVRHSKLKNHNYEIDPDGPKTSNPSSNFS